MTRHGRHWPREEQNANAFDGFGDLSGDEAAAARVHANWAAVFPPFDMPDDPYRPEFDTDPRRSDGREEV